MSRYRAALILWLTLLASCGDNLHPTVFTLTVTVSWASDETPQVTAVSVDGDELASRIRYEDRETFESYADALANYAPPTVVVTTTTQVQTFAPTLRWCMDARFPAGTTVIGEEDPYFVSPTETDPTNIDLITDCGRCAGDKGLVLITCGRTR